MSRLSRPATLVIGALLTTASIVVLLAVRPSPPEPDPEAARITVSPLLSATIDPSVTEPSEDLVRVRVVPPSAEPLPQTRSIRSSDSALDPRVRRLVAAVSSHPRLISLLATDGLIERFVASVEAVASGYSPRRELAPIRPHAPFLTRRDGESLIIAESSFRRYDAAVDLLTSVDAAAAVAVLDELEPELEAAHHRMAWSDESFFARLEEALDHMLEVEVPAGPYEVSSGEIAWEWADERFDRLSSAQQHLLRLGPDNARRLQTTLAEVRGRLADRDAARIAAHAGPAEAPTRAARSGGFVTSARPAAP